MDLNQSTKLLESYVSSKETHDEIALRTIADCLSHYAEDRPDQSAFVFLNSDFDREVITWKQMYDRSVTAARGFIQLGVKKGEVVAVNVRARPEWLYANFGAMIAGATVANISFTYTDGSDIIALMEKLETCSAMVLDPCADDSNWNIFQTLVEQHSKDGMVTSSKMPYLRYLVLIDFPSNTTNVLTLQGMMTDAPSNIELPPLNGDDIHSVFQTSGSTGVPKLAGHTHTSFILSIQRYDQIHPGIANTVQYNDRPFGWLGGWPLNILNGATRVTRSGVGKQPENNVEFMIEAIRREKCTYLFTLPPVLHALLQEQRELGENWPLIFVLSSGQPITRDFAKCVGRICKYFLGVYAGTESGPLSVAMVSAADDFEEYSCGTPLPGAEVKIVDEKNDIVPVGQIGEIYIRSKTLFKLYWNDPEKTKSVLSPDGWFRTDDVGHLSESGALFVEGRKSDMILSGGMTISPVILETAIKICPGVSAAMVVPISHPVMYQVLCACVITLPGSDVTEETVRRYCESIHNDKPKLFTVLPEYYLVMEEFPKTTTGKISRKNLAVLAEKLIESKYV